MNVYECNLLTGLLLTSKNYRYIHLNYKRLSRNKDIKFKINKIENESIRYITIKANSELNCKWLNKKGGGSVLTLDIIHLYVIGGTIDLTLRSYYLL